MTDQVAALVLLAIVAAFAAYLVSRLGPQDLKEVFLSGSVVIIAGALFCILLVVQLLQPQTWMADVLKVVGGVVAGSIAAKKADAKQQADLTAHQVAIGEQIQQAARDINNIQSELSKIERSVVNQYQQVRRDADPVVAADRETARNDINYRDNAEVVAEYERISCEHPDDFAYKPILGEDVRHWYNRKVKFFENIPGALELLDEKVRDIRKSGWDVVEVRFDFSSVNVTVLLETERRIPLDEVESRAAA